MEQEKSTFSLIGEWFGSVYRVISGSIFPTIREGFDALIDDVEKRIIMLQKRIAKIFASFAALIAGGIFLSIAMASFMIEYLSWPSAASFFLIGLLWIIIGLILWKGQARR